MKMSKIKNDIKIIRGERQMTTCPRCWEDFGSKYNLDRHLTRKQLCEVVVKEINPTQKQTNRFDGLKCDTNECPYCNKLFSTLYNLERHLYNSPNTPCAVVRALKESISPVVPSTMINNCTQSDLIQPVFFKSEKDALDHITKEVMVCLPATIHPAAKTYLQDPNAKSLFDLLGGSFPKLVQWIDTQYHFLHTKSNHDVPTIPDNVKQDLLVLQDHQCGYCRTELNDIVEYDHIIPKKHWGNNDMHNLLASCITCHSWKSTLERKRDYGCSDESVRELLIKDGWTEDIPIFDLQTNPFVN